MSLRRPVGRPPRQTPYRRTYPGGRAVWVARYYDSFTSEARYAKPRWNGGKASFARKADAQRAIDEALERLRGGARAPSSLRAYRESWPRRHPRSERTNRTNVARISRVLEVEIGGRPLGDWEFDELRRSQVLDLVDHMLCVEGRAVNGVRGIVSALSAMTEDAIGDDAAGANPFTGLRLRATDAWVRKPPREVRVWSFEEMRAFARGGRPEVRARTPRPPDPRGKGRRPTRRRCYPAHDYEPMLLTPGLTGLRLGELLALKVADFDGETLTLRPRWTAHEGKLIPSSREKNHRRSTPVPPTLAALIPADPESRGSEPLFPTPMGLLWRERNFYRDVWVPAQLATGLDPTPHEFRHSYVTHLRAAGVDDADLAQVAGHSVATMIHVYTHALGRSHDRIREIIG